MPGEAVAFLSFAFIVLVVLTGGLLRVVWVVLYDEFIGFAKPPEEHRFDVVMNPPQVAGYHPALADSAGRLMRYRVTGVMPVIKADVTMHLNADSLAQARQRAELAGVAVTDVGEV